MVRTEPEATRPLDLTAAVEGFGGALVARVERRGNVSLGGSGFVSPGSGRGLLREAGWGWELALVPMAGSFLGWSSASSSSMGDSLRLFILGAGVDVQTGDGSDQDPLSISYNTTDKNYEPPRRDSSRERSL